MALEANVKGVRMINGKWTLEIAKPDDWHLHLRDGARMASVVRHSAERFARAIIMPNLPDPIRIVDQAIAYYHRILRALPEGSEFKPLMTLYATDHLSPEEVQLAAESDIVFGVKLYPAGATTNSDKGVTDISNIYPALYEMQKVDLPLLVHGEVTDPRADIFDREKRFIDEVLRKFIHDFPGLRIVLEHITTKDGVEFVLSQGPNVAATITAHHPLYNRNAILAGGIRSHFYCLPVLKREIHRQALLSAATSGNQKFFLGTDSAPHPREGKEAPCGCAGIYSAHAAIELYAEVFEQAGKLDKLEGFASRFGPRFYRMPVNTNRIRLVKDPWTVPKSYPFGDSQLVPLRAGEEVQWKLVD